MDWQTWKTRDSPRNRYDYQGLTYSSDTDNCYLLLTRTASDLQSRGLPLPIWAMRPDIAPCPKCMSNYSKHHPSSLRSSQHLGSVYYGQTTPNQVKVPDTTLHEAERCAECIVKILDKVTNFNPGSNATTALSAPGAAPQISKAQGAMRFVLSFSPLMQKQSSRPVLRQDVIFDRRRKLYEIFQLSSGDDLLHFSMPQDSLNSIVQRLQLPPRLIDVITSKRNESQICYSWGSGSRSSLKYIIRTEKRLPYDLVLAVSWQDRKVHAILHGLKRHQHESEKDHLSDRLVKIRTNYFSDANAVRHWLDRIPKDQVDCAWTHPLLPAIAIIELQLSRYRELLNLYKELTNNMRVSIMNATGGSVDVLNTDDSKIPLDDWSQTFPELQAGFARFIYFVRAFSEIISVVDQLGKEVDMSQHAECREIIACRMRDLDLECRNQADDAQLLLDNTVFLQETSYSFLGARDSEVNTAMAAANTKTAEASFSIAEATSRDSSALKALAVITALFLPTTATATILAMPIIDWSKRDLVPVVRPSIWVFLVTSSVLTFATLYSWRFWYTSDVYRRDINILLKRDPSTKTTAPSQVPTQTDAEQGKQWIARSKKQQKNRKQQKGILKKRWPFAWSQRFSLKQHYPFDEESLAKSTAI